MADCPVDTEKVLRTKLLTEPKIDAVNAFKCSRMNSLYTRQEPSFRLLFSLETRDPKNGSVQEYFGLAMAKIVKQRAQKKVEWLMSPVISPARVETKYFKKYLSGTCTPFELDTHVRSNQNIDKTAFLRWKYDQEASRIYPAVLYRLENQSNIHLAFADPIRCELFYLESN